MADRAPDQPETPPAGQAEHAEEQSAALAEARACVGAKLDELGGAPAGRVDGVLVDALDGTPTWLVVRLGRFGRRVAVPYESAVLGVGHVWVPYPRETIRAASNLDPSSGLTTAEERELVTQYDIPETTSRPAALTDRPPEAQGSTPAGA
ncbi:MAG: PRC-barrel domain-containing protein [Solirubrobacterales bacterium]|nr:PRC-barrel domain-containing protein [Solirubrobacterales bacterium]